MNTISKYLLIGATVAGLAVGTSACSTEYNTGHRQKDEMRIGTPENEIRHRNHDRENRRYDRDNRRYDRENRRYDRENRRYDRDKHRYEKNNKAGYGYNENLNNNNAFISSSDSTQLEKIVNNTADYVLMQNKMNSNYSDYNNN